MKRSGLSVRHLKSLKAQAEKIKSAYNRIEFASGLPVGHWLYRTEVWVQLNSTIPDLESVLSELKSIKEELE